MLRESVLGLKLDLVKDTEFFRLTAKRGNWDTVLYSS